ncbi:MAG: hypothetical protein U0996_11395 [Planctomycetaceae bacterium]
MNRDGRIFGIPVSRRLTWDLLFFHRSVPLCPHERVMNLGPVSQARDECPVRISWPALFLKAFSQVAVDFPEYRQIWYRWPWAHIYQHPVSIATLTVSREIDGVPWLFWGQVPQPDQVALDEIQFCIRHFQTSDATKTFAEWMQFAALPTFLRRIIWWWNLNVGKRSRAKRVGTFFLSTLAGKGVDIPLPPSIHSACLSYGPLDEQQNCRVVLAYDHRLMDGARVADSLIALERVLNTAIVAELQSLRSSSLLNAA